MYIARHISFISIELGKRSMCKHEKSKTKKKCIHRLSRFVKRSVNHQIQIEISSGWSYVSSITLSSTYYSKEKINNSSFYSWIGVSVFHRVGVVYSLKYSLFNSIKWVNHQQYFEWFAPLIHLLTNFFFVCSFDIVVIVNLCVRAFHEIHSICAASDIINQSIRSFLVAYQFGWCLV